ncbi:MAG: transposase family protein [Caldilineaceae bacterium SB0664_bin_22]|nr:transposase family protein [Caldilineaceae bacterium SB0664_bin_22]
MTYYLKGHAAALMEALCAFADHRATLPDPRDPRGVRHALPVLLSTLLVALAGGAHNMAAVAAFTYDQRAWFRLWLPLGEATNRPPRVGLFH